MHAHTMNTKLIITLASGAVLALVSLQVSLGQSADWKRPGAEETAALNRADRELTRTYEQLLATLDTKQQAALREAQRAWIKWREAEALFVAGSTSVGGSAFRDDYLNAMSGLAAQRTRELNARLRPPSYSETAQTSSPKTSPPSATVPTTTPTPSVTQVARTRISTDTLYAAYQSNQIVANEKYDGREIVLTGDVWQVGTDSEGPYAILSAAGSPGAANAVWCRFVGSDGPRVVRLPKDGTITVTGRVDGKRYELTVINCRLQ